MHVSTENRSAMLDGPMPNYVHTLQRSLEPMQHKTITATVPAVVCELNAQLDRSIEEFDQLYLTSLGAGMPTEPASGETWVELNTLHVAMLMPVLADNTNLVVANWNSAINETFGSHLRQYSLWRQNYKGTWRISQSSVELVEAIETSNRIDDHCLLSSNWLAPADLYIKMFHEYDWRYRTNVNRTAKANIKSDSIILASMIWSRLAALAPGEVIENPLCSSSDVLLALRYDTNVTIETVALTITPGWPIIIVLGLYPIILCVSYLYRLLVWPLSPIGEGFGLISLMASVERCTLALLEGASLSGKLKRPVFIGFGVSKGDDELTK